jgi:glycosyltransferase involved in cell wall biosynthesis
MHIALVTFGYQPFRTSGFDLAGERLAHALLAAGHHVTIIAAGEKRSQEVDRSPGLEILRIALGRTNWYGFAYRAVHLLNRIPQYDVLHFYDVSFSYAYRGPYVASLQHSFRQRLESLGLFPGTSATRWLYRYVYYSFARNFAEAPGLRRAKGLLATSVSTMDEYARNYSVDPGRMVLARHSVDTNTFRRIPDRSEFRQKLGFSADEPVILFVGFITPRKGIEYVAQAMPMMDPIPRLLIVGKWRDNGYRQFVIQKFGKFWDKIIEVGFVPDDQMASYYSAADVYVSASLMEGFGLPPGEALSCETPVVVTDAGASAEVAGPGGFVVSPRDSEGIARAVSILLKDPQMRWEMGQAGRKHIEGAFSVQAMLNSTLEAYMKFLGVEV